MKPNRPGHILRDIGRRVAETRVGLGLTQEGLAERLGVSARYLQSVEAGRQNLTVATLAQLANSLRVRLTELMKAPRSRRVVRGRPKRRG